MSTVKVGWVEVAMKIGKRLQEVSSLSDFVLIFINSFIFVVILTTLILVDTDSRLILAHTISSLIQIQH